MPVGVVKLSIDRPRASDSPVFEPSRSGKLVSAGRLRFINVKNGPCDLTQSNVMDNAIHPGRGGVYDLLRLCSCQTAPGQLILDLEYWKAVHSLFSVL